MRDPAPSQIVFACFMALVLGTSLIWGCSALYSVYSVWSQHKLGQAEFAHAEANRQIKILEAKAAMESAHHYADAEVIRAEGVAKANKIIGTSLHDNESYLRYLWITSLNTSQKEIIYIPTEANIPILEAGRNPR